MLFRLSRRARRDHPASPASLADARHAVLSRAAAGLTVAEIAWVTGHSPEVVRNVISGRANDEAARQPVRGARPERRPAKEPLTSQERAASG